MYISDEHRPVLASDVRDNVDPKLAAQLQTTQNKLESTQHSTILETQLLR